MEENKVKREKKMKINEIKKNKKKGKSNQIKFCERKII
jgi:hypothetical protein